MAPPSKAPASPQVDEETMNAIRKRLIETGDWERISGLLRDKLEEVGFADDLKDFAKERARQQEDPKLEALLAEVLPKAREMLDPSLRAAVVQEIGVALEREVEPA